MECHGLKRVGWVWIGQRQKFCGGGRARLGTQISHSGHYNINSDTIHEQSRHDMGAQVTNCRDGILQSIPNVEISCSPPAMPLVWPIIIHAIIASRLDYCNSPSTALHLRLTQKQLSLTLLAFSLSFSFLSPALSSSTVLRPLKLLFYIWDFVGKWF